MFFSFGVCVCVCVFVFSVSVALSSVHEDTDSPRVMRRVESDQRQPPAVSEEDLSVASLLDIPSWAEPVGHSNLESIHSDLLEELEIPQYMINYKLLYIILLLLIIKYNTYMKCNVMSEYLIFLFYHHVFHFHLICIAHS